MERRARINTFHSQLMKETSQLPLGYYISGWSSEDSQRARFDALVRTSGFKGGRVVDYGCGPGDLFAHLERLGYEFDYVGLDQNEKMISLANRRFGDRFRQIDLDSTAFERTDYVFASGIFQFRDVLQPDYYATLLRQLFDKCDKALTVNLLSASRELHNKVEEELYLTPHDAVSLADGISDFWALDHSYHPGCGDMTLSLHRTMPSTAWTRPAVSTLS